MMRTFDNIFEQHKPTYTTASGNGRNFRSLPVSDFRLLPVKDFVTGCNRKLPLTLLAPNLLFIASIGDIYN